MSQQEHSRDLPLSPEAAMKAVASAAEEWGAEWQREGASGRLVLPVSAGLRHGFLLIRAWAEPAGDRCRLHLRTEQRRYRLRLAAVVILIFGAAGALSITLWPFFPRLLGVAPLALIFAMSAWLLVVSRLRTSGPEDFLDLVAKQKDSPPTA